MRTKYCYKEFKYAWEVTVFLNTFEKEGYELVQIIHTFEEEYNGLTERWDLTPYIIVYYTETI